MPREFTNKKYRENMKRIFLMGLGLVCLLSCDKSKISNTIENKDYAKIRDNASSDDNAPELKLSEYLINNGFDKNGDKVLQDRELAQIESLKVVGQSITDLDVLAKMTNLKQADFSGNKISVASISAPLLTELNLSNNRLIKLDISKSPKLVSNINLTGNPKLTCVKTERIQRTTIINKPKNIKVDTDKEGRAKKLFELTCN